MRLRSMVLTIVFFEMMFLSPTGGRPNEIIFGEKTSFLGEKIPKKKRSIQAFKPISGPSAWNFGTASSILSSGTLQGPELEPKAFWKPIFDLFLTSLQSCRADPPPPPPRTILHPGARPISAHAPRNSHNPFLNPHSDHGTPFGDKSEGFIFKNLFTF